MEAKSTARFGVIGTGTMAAAMMSTFARAGVTVAAIASRDPQRGERFAKAYGIQTISQDLPSFLQSAAFDAVYIANASSDHASSTIAALQAGKAVLCEKPIAVSVAEAERVAEVATRTRTLCMEGMWISFLPAYRRFIGLARTHACGVPKHLITSLGYPASEISMPRLYSSSSGGVLLDRGIYLVNLAFDVFGPVKEVESLHEISESGVDQHASLQLRHEGDGQSQLVASFTSLLANTATLACSSGFICLEEPLLGAETVLIRPMNVAQTSQDFLPSLRVKEKLAHRLRTFPMLRRLKRAFPSGRREYFPYGPDPYLPQLLHFISLLEVGAKESNIVPLDLSVRLQRVIDRARRQIADGQKEPP
jgi:predicted dehydrogenase